MERSQTADVPYFGEKLENLAQLIDIIYFIWYNIIARVTFLSPLAG